MSPRSSQQLARMREETREKILGTALQLFARRGFHGASIGEIARQAGLSKGLAYHYFESKQAILEAIIEEGFAEIERMMTVALDVEDPHQKLVVLLERTFAVTEQDSEFWRVFTGLILQPDIWEGFQQRFMKFFEGVIGSFVDLFASLGFEDPRAEALLFAATLDGIMLHFILDQPEYPLEQVKNGLIRRYPKR